MYVYKCVCMRLCAREIQEISTHRGTEKKTHRPTLAHLRHLIRDELLPHGIVGLERCLALAPRLLAKIKNIESKSQNAASPRLLDKESEAEGETAHGG